MNKEPKYVVRLFNTNKYLNKDGKFNVVDFIDKPCKFNSTEDARNAKIDYDFVVTVLIEPLYEI